MTRHVYVFGDDIGKADPKKLLGGKGAGLFEMTRLGVSVPPGFTISAAACRAFSAAGGEFPDGLDAQVSEALRRLEADVGRSLGVPDDPLLVSVRSGAAVSMPGMMDTVLNLGLNDETVEGLAERSGDRRFAFDAYRRFIEMFSDVVLGVPREHFEEALRQLKRSLGEPTMPDHEVPAAQLEELAGRFLRIAAEGAAAAFPTDTRAQLNAAIRAVFSSWDNPRAVRYRRMQDIPHDLGTAVTVQAMVFGNRGDDSGSGVAFTRNPSTGERVLYGEFLANAQGEDVVAGIRTPKALTARAATPGREGESLQSTLPDAFAEVEKISQTLERHFRDMQDVEFTIEKGRVYILQTRNGKRTAHAAVKIAVDMVDEKLIDSDDALLRVEARSLDQLLHATLPEPDVLEEQGIRALAAGLPASPGAAMGQIVLSADEAERRAAEGIAVILVRRETSPEDIHGMKAAEGIVTATGGMTSHAAVVARGLGKCCVAGVNAMNVDYETQTVTVRTEVETIALKPGDIITLDGSHGRIYRGELEVEAASQIAEFERLMQWADERRRLGVRANTDTPKGARSARSFGAEGVGLCRTEHMFFAEDRLLAVRCMALSETREGRAGWLDKLAPVQRLDFEAIFEAMDGLPVTVRLLDWPLHEFLPREDDELAAVAEAMGEEVDAIRKRATNLSEVNPMLGHRGVRVGLTQPTIYRMQTRAIVEAAVEVGRRGVRVAPEIMIPVVAMAPELAAMAEDVRNTAAEVLASAGVEQPLLIGTMIELPRACLVAGDLAKHADFFSFGTNDLTQTTFGISRDDAGRFLSEYLDDPRGLLDHDPFARLDPDGVGELLQIAVERGRRSRSDLKLGLCGEHGGDAPSIAIAESLGLDYVSCSPPRLPIARLAAAQATIRAGRT